MTLLKDPDIKRPTQNLDYLVIDYTQFDDWSSEEEMAVNAGIEKGYENWANYSSDDGEPVVERVRFVCFGRLNVNDLVISGFRDWIRARRSSSMLFPRLKRHRKLAKSRK